MSIFNTILQKLGIEKPAETPATPAAAPAPAPKPVTPAPAPTLKPAAPMPTVHPGATPTPPAHPGPEIGGPGYIPPKPLPQVAVPMVDVVAKLDALAKKNPMLDWKVSINDLMALLGMDHSPAAIKELAVELACPADLLEDSYKRNVWTHKELLKRIAANGGNIPPYLLK